MVVRTETERRLPEEPPLLNENEMAKINKPLTQQLIALKANQTRTNSKRRLLKKNRYQIHSLELVSIVMKKDTKSEIVLIPKRKEETTPSSSIS